MEIREPKSLTIKNWSPEDRPREKLLQRGAGSLSEAELIAILIGSGTTTQSAVEVAKGILLISGHSLNDLARFSTRDLMKVRGIGQARAVTIVAALELGRRRRDAAAHE